MSPVQHGHAVLGFPPVVPYGGDMIFFLWNSPPIDSHKYKYRRGDGVCKRPEASQQEGACECIRSPCAESSKEGWECECEMDAMDLNIHFIWIVIMKEMIVSQPQVAFLSFSDSLARRVPRMGKCAFSRNTLPNVPVRKLYALRRAGNWLAVLLSKTQEMYFRCD